MLFALVVGGGVVFVGVQTIRGAVSDTLGNGTSVPASATAQPWSG